MMLTSRILGACMLGLLLGYHNWKMDFLYTDYIPGQILFPFCCCFWAGLNSVPLPKMKPNTLHGGWHMQTYFHQGGNIWLYGCKEQQCCLQYLVGLTWCLIPGEYLPLFLVLPDSQTVVDVEHVLTWGQSGSTHGRGVRRCSGHSQVVIHLFYLGNTQGVACLHNASSMNIRY